MPEIISKETGEPGFPVCVWVATLDNPVYEALLEKYAYEIKNDLPIIDPEYHAMIDEFLTTTNQTVRGE
jgi:hypothetical protein